jgi:riboflavin kinase, archaea type
MEIKGKIISGTHKGSYFMSLEAYQEEFGKKLKFKPFPGTLNLQISKENRVLIQDMCDKVGIIKGTGNYGDVKFLPAKLNGIVNGAILFPVKTQHPSEILEFVAEENLRSTLKLKDGDEAILTID